MLVSDRVPAAPAFEPVPFPTWDDWVARARGGAHERHAPAGVVGHRDRHGGRRRADPGLAKDARDLELPPWNKGRYGTAVGSAVHAVLQTVDLVTGDGVDETAAAQAAAEGVIGRERDIAALARSALASATVREAIANDYRREMYVATQVNGHTLEGYVDLVFRTPDGLVVVDYKTDAWRDESDLDAKVARYRLQGASYALALEAATGEPVARCVFLFLGTDRAEERAVNDLPRAIEEVRALLAGSAGSS